MGTPLGTITDHLRANPGDRVVTGSATGPATGPGRHEDRPALGPAPGPEESEQPHPEAGIDRLPASQGRGREPQPAGSRAIEAVYRAEHQQLWRALLAYTGDPELASEAEAEAFAQALGRGDALQRPGAWIWTTAFRVAGGLLADRGRSVPLAPFDGDQAGRPTRPVDQPVLDQPVLEFLDLLAGLSDQQRAVVVLRYAGRFKPAEIADILGTTSGSVRVQLHRAHDRLKANLGTSTLNNRPDERQR
jgi:RNA polymerase sigma-70 factor (ECF subfamily)